MSYITIFGLSIGLAMDAFAVSISYGCAPKKISVRDMFIIALFFGAFQALMPITGWYLGKFFANLIQSFAHWIALWLLSYIGIKMIIDGVKDDDTVDSDIIDSNSNINSTIDIKRLFILSIATSIDALVVGLSLSFIGYDILIPAVIIGLVTFICSLIGVRAGVRLRSILGKKAEIFGGIVLIAIGIKILVEHITSSL
ncbi:MAG: manganese efflux pump MntP family protein [Spirochaetes bacterium]|nr:manganese efflux pump MntP family protein [Spirochaetota bacterium]